MYNLIKREMRKGVESCLLGKEEEMMKVRRKSHAIFVLF
jgi:hypothetical protein